MLLLRLAGPEWQPGLVIGNTAHQAPSHQTQTSYVLLLAKNRSSKGYLHLQESSSCMPSAQGAIAQGQDVQVYTGHQNERNIRNVGQ
jgi:hypothetical protein